jgi:hypothetical protein
MPCTTRYIAPHFAERLADLQGRLIAADVGLDHVRMAADDWIESGLTGKRDAMAAFHHALCVGGHHFSGIRRADGAAGLVECVVHRLAGAP